MESIFDQEVYVIVCYRRCYERMCDGTPSSLRKDCRDGVAFPQ
jgi:hypothetical protein